MALLLPTADDVRDVRRVLASWDLERYIAVRDEQRASGDAPPELVFLRHNATLEEALRTLSVHRILSAPILNAYTGDFSGFFSLSDLLKSLLKGLFPALLAPQLTSAEAMLEFIRAATPESLKLNDLAQWARSGFLSEHLVRPGADGDIVFRGFTTTSFLDLISHGLKRSSPDEVRFGDFEPSHRYGPLVPSLLFSTAANFPLSIAIYDELPEGKMKIVEVVSQSDVLRALLRDKDALGTFPAVRTVEELFGRKDVLTVPSNMPAIAVRLVAKSHRLRQLTAPSQAFALMHNLDISGVPVVDPVSGHMVANLSVSDLRCLRTPDDFDLLGLEAIRFAHARWESEANLEGLAHAGAQPPTPGTAVPAQQERRKRPAVVTVAMDATLLHVIECLVHFRVHRVYVEEKARPVSVVTITDVLRLFAVDPNDDREGLLSF